MKCMSNVSSSSNGSSMHYRGVQGYRASASVPALELTRRLTKADRRAVPRTGERVPYIIVHGEPGEYNSDFLKSHLKQLCPRCMSRMTHVVDENFPLT